MKRVLIFLNGSGFDEKAVRQYVRKTALVIAADGGAEYAVMAGIIPDVVIGDMDSISDEIIRSLTVQCHPKFISGSLSPNRLKDAKIEFDSGKRVRHKKKQIVFITYPQEKDQTDSELAVKYALDHKAEEIVLFGFYGNRIDHVVANIGYLSEVKQCVLVKIVESDQEVYFVHNTIKIRGAVGDELSLIPLQQDVKEITTYGLQYVLDHEDLPFGSTRGVSNVFLQENVKITVRTGVLMVVHRLA